MSVSMAILGKRLKEARLRCGYTQEYVAEQIDFSVPHLRGVERGVKSLNLVKLGAWCDVLDVPIEQIVAAAYTPENAAHNRQFGEIASKCSPEAIEVMLDVCEQIARLDTAKR